MMAALLEDQRVLGITGGVCVEIMLLDVFLK